MTHIAFNLSQVRIFALQTNKLELAFLSLVDTQSAKLKQEKMSAARCESEELNLNKCEVLGKW